MKYISIALFLSLTFFHNGLAQEFSKAHYYAGFMTLHLVDSSRTYKPDSPKTDSLHFRPIDLDIWYPSDHKKNEPLDFGDLFKLFEQRASNYQNETDYSGLTEELARFYVAELGVGIDGQKLLAVKTNSFANLLRLEEKFPVIIYMAGFNGMGFENFKVLENLTQNGFIVISISSVGRYPGDMTNKMEDMMEQVYDAEFALKQLGKGNELGVDLSKIGILGCSWGGMGAAVLVNRNPNIKAMVSFDGSETHYYGETDFNAYANGANGEDNDRFIKGIYDANLLDTENQSIAYLYLESGDKLNEFTPTDEYHYYKKLNSEKYYLRFKNSEHANFVCIPSILDSSEDAVSIYGHLENATVDFFKQNLKGTNDYDNYWSTLKALDNTTNDPYDISRTRENNTTEVLGRIFDRTSNEPLPYVNIGVLNREVGTVTDTEGNFQMPLKEEFENDTIKISMVGYESIELLVKDIWKMESPLNFKMKEKISELNEVVVIAKAYKKKTLGNKSESKFISTGFNYDQLGAEMGIKVNIRKNPTIVDAFHFNISYNRLSSKSIFRLNFYNLKKGKPFENVLDNNILVPIEPKQTGLISVDLKPYDIVLNEDVVIALEWVDTEGENNEGEAIFFSLGLLTNGTLYKKSSQAKFKKHSSLGVGFNIDVRI